eukprot:7637386-Pyramimonas_sp.AAC.1
MSDILYYEVLDIPLPELERLKILKLAFHNHKTEQVGDHQVRKRAKDTLLGAETMAVSVVSTADTAVDTTTVSVVVDTDSR